MQRVEDALRNGWEEKEAQHEKEIPCAVDEGMADPLVLGRLGAPAKPPSKRLVSEDELAREWDGGKDGRRGQHRREQPVVKVGRKIALKTGEVDCIKVDP